MKYYLAYLKKHQYILKNLTLPILSKNKKDNIRISLQWSLQKLLELQSSTTKSSQTVKKVQFLKIEPNHSPPLPLSLKIRLFHLLIKNQNKANLQSFLKMNIYLTINQIHLLNLFIQTSLNIKIKKNYQRKRSNSSTPKLLDHR